MGNTTKKDVFFEYSLYDMIFFSPNIQLEIQYVSPVLGAIVRCPQGTGSEWEIKHDKRLFFLHSKWDLVGYSGGSPGLENAVKR